MSINTICKMLILRSFEKYTPELPKTLEMNCTKLKEIVEDLHAYYKISEDLSFYNIYGIQIISNLDYDKLEYGDIVYCIPSNIEFPYELYLEDYEFESILGKGGYGTVYRVKNKFTNKIYALKVKILSDDTSAMKKSEIFTEAKNIKMLNHPNIFKLLNSFYANSKLYLLSEYIEGGDLGKFIKSQEILEEEKIKEILKQIIQATLYFHSHNIIHRDLKLENILVSNLDPLTLKIIDFGIACNKGESHSSGTLRYLPPECILQKYQSKESLDTYSIGVILYYLCFRLFPFEGNSSEEIEDAIINHEITIPPNLFSNKLNNILNGLLEKEEKKRINLDYVSEHLYASEQTTSNDSSPNLKTKFEIQKEEYHCEEKLTNEELLSSPEQKKEENRAIKNSPPYQLIVLDVKKKVEDYIDGKVISKAKTEIQEISSNTGKLIKKNTLQKIIVEPKKLKKCESQIKMKFPSKVDQIKFNTPNAKPTKNQENKTKFFNDPSAQNYQKKLYKKSTFSVGIYEANDNGIKLKENI